jgi:hypothetical protein
LTRVEVVHLGVLSIEQQQTLLPIEYAQAMLDTIERKVAQLNLAEQGSRTG